MGKYHCIVTSCLTALDKSVFLQIKTKIVSSHTDDSKPVKQEVNSTVILPPFSIPWFIRLFSAEIIVTLSFSLCLSVRQPVHPPVCHLAQSTALTDRQTTLAVSFSGLERQLGDETYDDSARRRQERHLQVSVRRLQGSMKNVFKRMPNFPAQNSILELSLKSYLHWRNLAQLENANNIEPFLLYLATLGSATEM